MNFDRDSKIKSKYIILLLSTLWFLSCNHKNPTQNQSLNTWISVSQGLTCKEVQCLAIDPLDHNILYAGTKQGIFKTTNAAKNWQNQSVNMTKKDIKSIAIHPLKSNIIIAGTWGGGIFKSIDSGSNWTVANSGLTNPLVYYVSTLNLDSLCFFSCTMAGLFISKDEGTSWKFLENSPYPATYVAILKQNELLVGVKSNGIFSSRDNGLTWYRRSNGLFLSFENRYVSPTSIIAHPEDENILYISTDRGIYKTIDGAENWLLFSDHIANAEVNQLVLDIANPSKLYAATNRGVYKTSNGAQNWELLNNGIASADVQSIALDQKNPNIVYIGTLNGGVFKLIQD